MILKRLLSWENPNSLSNRKRSQRMALFEALLGPLARPIKLLDIGGTVAYWQMRGLTNRSDLDITIVNLDQEPSPFSNIRSISGDATDLSIFPDQSFDVVFSNSVIEHVGPLDKQAKMAEETRRLAPRHWVQTPNYWFPIEPHFLFPGWQWLPETVRVAMLRRRGFGWNGRCPDPAHALAVVRHAQLLGRRDLIEMFPTSIMVPERFAGLTKSWIVVGGFSKEAIFRAKCASRLQMGRR